MSAFVTDSFLIVGRRALPLALVATLGWAPAGAALWMLLSRGVRIPNVSDFTESFYESPQQALTDLVLDPHAALVWSAVAFACYLLGQVVVSGAFTDQVYWSSQCAKRPWWRSLGRSVARIYRTLPAVVFLVAVVATALCIPVLVVATLAWYGERSWVFLLAVGLFCLVPSVILAVWAYGRLALMPTVAVLAPRRTLTVRISLTATSGRWWAVMGRLVLVALVVGAVSSVVATPLSVAGLSGSELVVSAALLGRIALSLLSGAVSSASLALIYADTRETSAAPSETECEPATTQ